jgi:hypothetical protein
LAEKYPSCSVVANPIAGGGDALRAFQRGLSIFEDVRGDDVEARSITRLCRQLSNCAAEKTLARQEE